MLLFSLVAFVYGTVFSSFVTLVGYRVPLKISINLPPSHCSSCGHSLGVLDLIPVLGSLLNRCKCRYCGVNYGSFHMWLEIVVGLLFAGCVWVFGLEFSYLVVVYSLVLLVNMNIVSWMVHRVLLKKITLVSLGVVGLLAVLLI